MWDVMSELDFIEIFLKDEFGSDGTDPQDESEEGIVVEEDELYPYEDDPDDGLDDEALQEELRERIERIDSDFPFEDSDPDNDTDNL
jgi:hypothetical protein